jgi:hypothetical protein
VSIDPNAGAMAGPFAVACVVLGFAGVSKIRRPVATQPAATAIGLPASTASVRILGITELAAAGAGLVIGHAAAVAVASMYGALAVVSWRLFVRSPGTACGCLGASDAPVSPVHILVNIAAIAVAALAAGAGSPLTAVGADSWARVAFVLLAGCGAWLAASALDALPALNAFVHEGRAQ